MSPDRPPAQTTVADYLDAGRLRGLMLLVPMLCAFLMVTEGIDAFGVGYVGPFLSKAYNISPQTLGLVYTSTVIASLLGAVVVAPLSDRIGRRNLLLATSLVMGPATLLTAVASNVYCLVALRFLIGLAFGAAFPVAIALTADYAPKRRRALLVMGMNASIALGMVMAGVAAAFLIPAFGWRSLLYASGAWSLLCTVLAWRFLPESLYFLVRRDAQNPAAHRIVTRLAADRKEPVPLLVAPDKPAASTPLLSGLALLRSGRTVMTMLLWFITSLSYVSVNFVAYWLPTVLLNAGASVRSAGLIVAVGKLAGVVGSVTIGWLMDRKGVTRMLGLSYAGTAVAVACLAGLVGSPLLALCALLAAFFLSTPSFSGSQAVAASAYPVELRATANGWITGLARLIGGGAGALLGGQIVGANWTPQQIALAMAGVYGFAAVAAAFLLPLRGARPDSRSLAAAQRSA